MNTVELDLEKITETDYAILLSDGINEYWIPKSQLQEEPQLLRNNLLKIIIPEWLAIQKEMV